ncbi:hypothetical protein GCM10027051_29100 [Niabella terrae]
MTTTTTNYEGLTNQAEAVLRRTAHINRLSLGEEQGRTSGGRANIEASLLFGTMERTNPSTSRAENLKSQEKILKICLG